jgi:hypothetical protein
VLVRGDTLNETDEFFRLNLLISTNATIADNFGLGTIRNDDFRPSLVQNSVVLSAESCTPSNRVVDPDETVMLTITLRNSSTGGAVASNLTARLLETGGVRAPGPAQTYGTLAPGATATRTFTFTAGGSCGGTVLAVLALEDAGGPLDPFTNSFTLGSPVMAFAENFDSVNPPALPPGWTATLSGAGFRWATTSSGRDTPPNSVFAPDPGSSSVNELTSPPIPITTPTAQLLFRHSFNTESNFDGGTLQVSVSGAPFRDVLAAGGRFVTGGYNGSVEFDTPAWTGNSGGFVTTLVNLPNAVGEDIIVRWRMTSDELVSSPGGWYVDSVVVTDGYACCSPPPLRVESIGLAGTLVVLRWSSVPGRRYQAQAKASLGTSPWLDLPGVVTATTTSTTTTDTLEASGQRFYRIVELP